MQDMRTVDFGLGLTRALSVANGNATDASLPSRIPTITKPSGVGVFDLKGQRQTVPRFLKGMFFGQGTANQTFTARVIGWQPIGTADGFTTLWVPYTLAEFTCTLGAATGVANTQAVAADKFVDTIVLVTGNSNVDVEIVSPADDTVAHALLDLKGSHLIEFLFAKVTVTNMNALFAHH